MKPFYTERVKELREARGWTQSDLARAIHEAGADKISRANIRNWELGMAPRFDHLYFLCRVFGVSPEYFFRDVPARMEMIYE